MADVLIDLYKIREINSGLGQFSRNFHQAMSQKPLKWNFSFLIPKGFGGQLDSFTYNEVNPIRRYFPNLGRGYDLWHSLHQFPSHFPPRKTPQLLTVHDLNFLKEKSERKAASYLNKLQRNINRAEFLSTISAATLKDMQKHLDLKGKEVRIIHNGVQLESGNASKPEIALSKPFFFSIGVFKPKKNFDKLLRMMKYFPNHQLVLAGNHSTAYGKVVENLVRELKLEKQVILTGEIKEAEKLWLYRNCAAFLFPSVAEGFGLPVIEALHEGCLVFCSSEGSLPEIGGKQAYFWKEIEPDVMAGLVRDKLKDPENKSASVVNSRKEYARKFSWGHCIDQYIDFYTDILG